MMMNSFVMAGLVPAIHALARKEVVDARHKAGHDESMANPLKVAVHLAAGKLIHSYPA
jgi:hypothetical protein